MSDRTDFVEQRRYTLRDLWRDVVPLLAVGLAGWAFLGDTPSTADLRRVEIKDRDTARATAYRLCTRNKVDRAFAHARIRGIAVRGEPSRVPGITELERQARRSLSRLLMQPEFLPILTCEPNLRGLGAAPMVVTDQERFLRRWAMRELPAGEIGVCPDSVIGAESRPDRC